MVVVHVLVDTGDAMGANLVNSLVEGLAPLVTTIAGGTPCLRIVSNLADRRRARACVRIALASLGTGDVPGAEVAERVRWAHELAANDPYRAATHNKGIMNGVDAVALATGNDWRAIEAGAHAYAARDGHYRPLSTWTVDDGHLVGTIEMPMATSVVGRLVQSHPQVALALRILNVGSARELAMIMVAVGLASNLGALRALVTNGIQLGHMELHRRAAGAR
jgi:hydroxymethylglutaryl-CoA reductase